jgi:solute carrier family 40 (iron-regulated transporter), member 1
MSCFELLALKRYFRRRDCLPSMALSCLYLTVISMGQLVTYLLSVGYTFTAIGLIRTVSIVFEISATWAAPRLTRRRFSVAIAVALFVVVEESFAAAAGLVVGVVGSRVGL